LTARPKSVSVGALAWICVTAANANGLITQAATSIRVFV
jgi:hypothetical protein